MKWVRLPALCLFAIGCATRFSATRPLQPQQLEEVQRETRQFELRVEPTTAGNLSLELRAVQFSADALQGLGDGGPRRVELADVKSVTWTKRTKGVGRGALAALFFGPLAGFAIGAGPTSAKKSCVSSCGGSEDSVLGRG